MRAETPTQKKIEKNEGISVPEQIESEKVKDITQSLIKAYSALKIYPIENPAVINSTMVFADKLMDFLSKYEEMKIGIHEFSLSFNEETLHEDGEKKKSFPFLLYKDGMRELSFHEGLDLEEIGEFLETVKKNADLPEEESDIIQSLWEKDFSHIHYFALDEFLDRNIGGIDPGSDLLTEKDTLTTGKIKLTQEDQDDIDKHMEILNVDPGNDFAEGPNTSRSKEKRVSEAAAFTESDYPEIEKLVSDDRESSRIKELIALLFEVLFLEDRKDQFSETLNVLDLCLQDTLEKANFSQASLILNQIIDLKDIKDIVPDLASDKLMLLDRIIKKTKDISAIQELEKLFLDGKVQNLNPFLDYLHILCPESIPTVINIWEKTKDLKAKSNISILLKKIGETHMETLVEFAQNSHASLAKEIISILGKINRTQSLPFLKKFAAHYDKSIRLETIQALKIIHHEDGDETLLELLQDKEEQIRIAAVTSLKHFGNSKAVSRISKIIEKNDFDKKNRPEKRVFLNYCAQNPCKEINLLFHSILTKRSFLFSSKALITRLCVVAALEIMGTPEAVTILKEGSLLKKKRIRNSCKLALRKLTARKSQFREIKVL